LKKTTKETLSATELDALMQGSKHLIEPIYPVGHKIMVAAIETGTKTWLLAASAIHVASGESFLGMKVHQSRVLMLDEETPTETLYKRLDRLAMGLGYQSYKELPIEVRSKMGFRFDSTRQLNQVQEALKQLYIEYGGKHVLITMDSHISMLGGQIDENNSKVGRVLGQSLDSIQRYCRDTLGITATILISAHAKKAVACFELDDIQQAEPVQIVRGHGSIVGLGSDTMYVLKRIAEYPLRGVIVTKSRRVGISENGKPMSDIYWELKEEKYSEGAATMERIDPVPIPPSELAVQLFSLFYNNEGKEFSSHALNKEMALEEPAARKLAVKQLVRNRIIINKPETPFTYRLSPHFHDASRQDKLQYDYATQLLDTYEAIKAQ
jgi:hypothetical protein